jgi:hypothetical protein
MSGKRLDIRAHVILDSSLRFEEVHRIVSVIEKEVRRNVQRVARITVQTEPIGHSRTRIAALLMRMIRFWLDLPITGLAAYHYGFKLLSGHASSIRL